MRNKTLANSLLTHAVLAGLALGISGASIAQTEEYTENASMTHEKSDAPVSDTWITTKVKADLLAAKEVKGMDINVSTTNGVVTLAGVLDTQAQVDKAIALTKNIKGVKGVETKALKVKSSGM